LPQREYDIMKITIPRSKMMMAGTTAGNTIGTTAIRRSQWRRFGLPVIGILFVTLASGAAIADAVVERISGLVEISEGDSNPWVAAENGDAITPGGRVRTGADGRVEVSNADTRSSMCCIDPKDDSRCSRRPSS
jgi:hypothetical protein